jgi:CRISPR system Cascade subunit CasD
LSPHVWGLVGRDPPLQEKKLSSPHFCGGWSHERYTANVNSYIVPTSVGDSYHLNSMKTITLNLSGLLAAYSGTPRLQQRLTQPGPTRSAVLGIIRCAMGIYRDVETPELSALRIEAISVESQGRLSDFHTIKNAVTYEGKPGRNSVTYRHYLESPEAVVEVSGDDETVDRVRDALVRPQWQLYLGRRNCVPSGPVLVSSLL